ncbi:MAG TPA: carboxypeptidase regulatory-like domain-containing protein, partial [Chloroflexota bacterium]|nr:carboxypeptidase regulatory-like domain-containing protein [Chloroflexota bacterium]
MACQSSGTTISASVSPLLAQATLVGRHDPQAPVTPTLMLGPGTTDSQRAAFETFMAGQGFQVQTRFLNNAGVRFQGLSSAAEQAFGVEIDDYQLGSRSFFANSTAVRLSPALAPMVVALVGLDNASQLTPSLTETPTSSSSPTATATITPSSTPAATRTTTATATSAAATSTATAALSVSPTLTSTATPTIISTALPTATQGPPPPVPAALNAPSGYTPAQLKSFYQVTALNTAGFTGQGQTIGILAMAGFNLTDVRSFETAYGLPQTSISVTQTGTPRTDSAATREATLSVEWASAMAPGASVVVAEVSDGGVADLIAGLNTLLAQHATVISISWGTCEAQVSANDMMGLDALLAQAGVPVLAASGDQGSRSCLQPNGAPDTSTVSVSWPASDPYVTAVGGTSLTPDATGNPGIETAWAGSGGGFSAQFTRPSWQPAGHSMRGLPDIALSADPAHGYAFYFQGAVAHAGGTSAAAPALAGVVAVVNQARGRNETALNADLYRAGAFGDLNPAPAVSNGDYLTAAGWDPVTGLGSVLGHSAPKAAALARHSLAPQFASGHRRLFFMPGIVPATNPLTTFGADARASDTFGNIAKTLSGPTGPGYTQPWHSFNYSSQWREQATYEAEDTWQSLETERQSLADQLRYWQSQDEPGTSYDIVAHSLGGSIAALWAAKETDPTLLAAVHSIVTLDSPVAGMLGSNWQGFFSFGLLQVVPAVSDLQNPDTITAMGWSPNTIDITTLSNTPDNIVPTSSAILNGACPTVLSTCLLNSPSTGGLFGGILDTDHHGDILGDPAVPTIIATLATSDGPLWWERNAQPFTVADTENPDGTVSLSWPDLLCGASYGECSGAFHYELNLSQDLTFSPETTYQLNSTSWTSPDALIAGDWYAELRKIWNWQCPYGSTALVCPISSQYSIADKFTATGPAIPNAFVATYASSPPTSWSAGQTLTYQITITNAGPTTWNAADPDRVRLGVEFGTQSDVPGDGWATDQRFDLPADVPAGGVLTLSVTVTAPPTPGTYVLRHRMVKENVAWFAQSQTTQVTVSAPLPVLITGTVLNGGTPVAGVNLSVDTVALNSGGLPAFTGPTDANGHYALEAPFGQYVIYASSQNGKAVNSTALTFVDASSGTNFPNENVTVGEALSILSGQVTDAVTHAPLPGAVISVGLSTTATGYQRTEVIASVTSDPGGGYALSLAPANYVLTVNLNGYQTFVLNSVKLMASGLTQNIALTAWPVTITGHITNVLGPVANVSPQIHFSRASPCAENCWPFVASPSDSNGNYTIYGPAGKYEIWATGCCPNTFNSPSWTSVDASQGGVFPNENIQVAAAVPVSGTVVDGTGRPVSNASVSISLASHLNDGQNDWITQAFTDSSGAFSLLAAPGTYVASVTATGYQNLTQTVTFAGPTAGLTLTVSNQAPVTITGRILAAGIIFLPGITPTVYVASGGQAVCYPYYRAECPTVQAADSTGTYTIQGQPGVYEIFVAALDGVTVNSTSLVKVDASMGGVFTKDLQVVASTSAFKGQITDAATRAGIAGADITLSLPSQVIPGFSDQIAATTTDGAGNYSVAVADGVYTMNLSLPAGYPPQPPSSVTISGTTTENFTETLFPVTISGRVVESGVPVANVQVDVSGHWSGACGGACFVSPGLTDSSGRYTIYGADGKYELYVDAFNGNASSPGSIVVDASGGGPISAPDVAVLPDTSISGTVTDGTTGAGISGAQITLLLTSQLGGSLFMGSSTSDTNGHYQVNLAPGTYTLQFYDNNYPPVASTTVTIPAGGLAHDIITLASYPVTITGHVLNGGSPVPNVGVTANCQPANQGTGCPYTTVMTDANGQYTVHGPLGTYQLFVQPGNSGNRVNSTSVLGVDATAGGTFSGKDLAVSSAVAVSGTITDATSHAGIAGAQVQVSLPAQPSGFTAYMASATADASGAYSLQLAPGTYSIWIWANGYPTSASSTVTITGATNAENFTLAAYPVTITGHVLNGGSPVANVGISSTCQPVDPSSGCSYANVITDASGAYTFRGSRGTYELYVEPGIFGNTVNSTSVLKVDATAGGTFNGKDLAVGSTVAVSGQVSDPVSHAGISGAYLEVDLPSQLQGSDYLTAATTDANGTYNLRLAPGTYSLFISSGGDWAPSHLSVTISGATSSENFTLSPYPVTITGHVLNGQTPVAGQFVSWNCLSSTSAPCDFSNSSGLTDSSGAFTLYANPGQYELFVSPEDRSGFNSTSPVLVDASVQTSISGVVVPVSPATTLISGQVTDGTSGIPYAEVTMSLPSSSFSGQHRIATLYSDGNGNYSVTVAQGTYTMRAFQTGYADSPKVSVTVGATAVTQNFTLRAFPVVMTGHVLNGQTGVQANVSWNCTSVSSASSASCTSATATQPFSADGSFTVYGNPGKYDLLVSPGDASGFNSTAPTLVDATTATSISNVVVNVAPATTNLSGQVTSQGSGVGGAVVQIGVPSSLFPGTYDLRPINADAAGRYSVNLAPGTYAVMAQASGFPDSAQTVLTIGNTAVIQNISLGPTVTLAAAGSSATGGQTMAVSWTGSTDKQDWIGLFATGASDASYLAWEYTSCTHSWASAAVTAGSCTFTLPTISGTYEFRFFSASGGATVTSSGTVTVSSAANLTAASSSATGGQSLAVSWTGSTDKQDWIGLFATGASDASYLAWDYTSCSHSWSSSAVASGSCTFTLPTAPGTYEFRFFSASSSAAVTSSGTVAVTSAASLAPSARAAFGGQSLAVSWTGSTDKQDWVALFATGASDTSYLTWDYTSCSHSWSSSAVPSGSCTITLPTTPGTYEFRFFSASSDASVATSASVSVSAAPTLTVASSSAFGGQGLGVSWTGSTDKQDWIGLFATGASDTSYLTWDYTSCSHSWSSAAVASGSCTFTLPTAPGTYEFRFFGASSDVSVVSSGTVNVTSAATLSAASSSATGGQSLAVSWTGSTDKQDWIGLYATGASDASYLAWEYTSCSHAWSGSAVASGSCTFTLPTTPGTYEFRFFSASGGAAAAASGTVTVSSATTISAAASSATAGQGMAVSWTGSTDKQDWIGLFATGASDTSYLAWAYTSCSHSWNSSAVASGSCTFTLPTTPGTYEFRFFSASSDTSVISSGTVSVTSAVTLGAASGNATGGQSLAVSWTGSTDKQDWIGVYATGASDASYLGWAYTSCSHSWASSAVASGSCTFTMPTTAGTYEFRFFSASSNVS